MVHTGKTPWLNDETGCSYPAPWIPVSPRDQMDDIYEDSDDDPWESFTADTINEMVDMNDGGFIRNITNRHLYIGDYHHPGFGTFQIYETNHQTLRYRYGRFLRGDILNVTGRSTVILISNRILIPLIPVIQK